MVDKACKVVVCGGGDGTVTSRLSRLALRRLFGVLGCLDWIVEGRAFHPNSLYVRAFHESRAVILNPPEASQAC